MGVLALGTTRRHHFDAERDDHVQLEPGTRVAVLGLLLDRPGWAYDVMTRMESRFAPQPWNWRVSTQSVYRAFRELQYRGFIEAVETSEAPPELDDQRARSNCRVTARGARAFREWLASPSVHPSRLELVLRIQLGDDDARLRTMLKHYTDACLAELEKIGAMQPSSRQERLLVAYERLQVQAELAWIELARAECRPADDHPIKPARA